MIMKIPQEPRLDPDCNQFKDFLVDHPCLNAKLKGDPHRLHDDDGGDDNGDDGDNGGKDDDDDDDGNKDDDDGDDDAGQPAPAPLHLGPMSWMT